MGRLGFFKNTFKVKALSSDFDDLDTDQKEDVVYKGWVMTFVSNLVFLILLFCGVGSLKADGILDMEVVFLLLLFGPIFIPANAFLLGMLYYSSQKKPEWPWAIFVFGLLGAIVLSFIAVPILTVAVPALFERILNSLSAHF